MDVANSRKWKRFVSVRQPKIGEVYFFRNLESAVNFSVQFHIKVPLTYIF